MAIDQSLLDLLVCPESREKLSIADDPLVEAVNGAIESGRVKSRAGRLVEEPIDAGLVRPDRKFLYAIRLEIPNLLIDDAIPLEGLV
jgi:uncharacterized protein YbaR (Trm112 family)